MTQAKKHKIEGLSIKIPIPEGISIKFEKNQIVVEGNNKKVSRKFNFGALAPLIKDKNVIINSPRDTRASRTLSRTLEAHIINLFKGIEHGFVYKMKICSGHFPMNVSVSSQEFIVKNFLGESYPRKLKLSKDVQVKVSGDEVTVKADTIELAGQTAASIEKLTVVKGRDLRVFQDGIYIIEKSGRPV